MFRHSHSAGGGGWASHLQTIRVVVRTFAMTALSTSTGTSLNATRPISQSSTRRLPSITTGREAMAHRCSVLTYECQVLCQPKNTAPACGGSGGDIGKHSGCVCASADCGRTRSHCLGQVEMSTNHQQCQTLHNYTGGRQHTHRQLSHAAPQQNKST